MSEPLFDDWDDFIGAVDGLVEKGIVERYTNEDGDVSLKLTELGREMAEMLKIKELAKENMGVEKYRKSENRRKQSWGQEVKEPKHWISDIIKSLSDLVDDSMPEDVREDLAEIIADLKEQDPHQYWGEQGTDY